MKIKKIHIDGFGKLHDFDIEPGDGITVFCGCNEAGKSTLHLFIRSILYGASTKRRLGARSCYERMRPWQHPEIYRGRMEIEFEQQRYMIERDFNKAADDLVIMELGSGGSTPVREPAELMKRILNGLSETAYINTVSAGQLGSATQKDMASELRKYSANISSTMNPKLSADRALAYLDREKTLLEAELHTEAPKEFNRVLTEIKRIEEQLELPENENKISLFTEAADKVSRDNDELMLKMNNADTELESCREALKQKGFSADDDIEGTGSRARADYAALKATEKKAKSRSAVAFIVLLAALAAAAAVYALKFAPDNYITAAAAAAGVCAAAAVILIVRYVRIRSQWRLAEDELVNELKPYLGDVHPDDEVMKHFDEYIDGARKLAAMINEISGRCEMLGIEQKKLNGERALYLDRLTAQQKTKDGVEEQLKELEQLKGRAVELQRSIRNNKLVREKLEALQLAEETLSELAGDIRNAAGTYINKEASRMISEITNHAYDSLSAGQSYDIMLNSKDGMISVADMSAGTADQVYLAVRLATIRFITGEEDPLPLILDDSFNLYDDDRLAASLSFLAKGYHGQVMIFTCQKREEEVLDRYKVPYRKLVMG